MKNALISISLIFCLILSGCSNPINYIVKLSYSMDEDEVYSLIENSLEDCKDEIVIYDNSYDKIDEIYNKVILDHPEYFWTANGYRYLEETEFGISKVSIIPLYSDYSEKTLFEKRIELKNKVDKIVSEAKKCSSNYDRVVFIHNYIINNTVYDDDTADVLLDKENEWKIFESSTAYGCLVKGLAICSGYAAAFQLLAEELGYECRRVGGEFEEVGHQWNLIKLDNEYYYVDVTFDDPIFEDKNDDIRKGEISHEFFCITLNELLVTHKLDEDEKSDYNFGTKYNYYTFNGFYVDKYDFNAVKNIILKQKDLGFAEIKFSSTYELEVAITDLFDNEKIFNIFPKNEKVDYVMAIGDKIITIRF